MIKIHESEFVPRLTAPTEADKRWTCIDAGGWSPCIDGKPQAWKGSVLSNCVGNAFARFAEIGDMTAKECMLGRVAGVGYPQSASVWWDKRAKMGYESGQVAKLGACGCWKQKNGTLGHVMIVEKIDSNGIVTVSGSSYNGAKWYLKTLDKNYNYSSSMQFQGWIYNPCVIPDDYPQPVERNTNVHQYEVTIDALLWRKGPGKTYDKYKDYVQLGIYNVIEQYNDGSYIWNKIGENYWFAGAYADGTDKHGKDYPVESDIDKLKAQIVQLTAQINEKNVQINQLNAKCEQLQAKIDNALKALS